MHISQDKLAAARVLVVGDAMLDRYWYGAVDRISPEAPVPVVRVTRTEERAGGAANVASNIVALGAQASLLTVVGDDEASHQLEALVASSGITPYFGRDVRLKTTVKLRVIGRQQQLVRLDFEDTPENEVLASQSSTFEKLFPTHSAVLFSDYSKGSLAHITAMIDHAKAGGKVVPRGHTVRLASRPAGSSATGRAASQRLTAARACATPALMAAAFGPLAVRSSSASASLP